jgi:hypothetical protein
MHAVLYQKKYPDDTNPYKPTPNEMQSNKAKLKLPKQKRKRKESSTTFKN